jgi:23S rRNA (adenine2503-C2)-methyltransferase
VDATLHDARRLLAHRISHGRSGRPDKSVSRSFYEAVERFTDDRRLEVVERATDADDGFMKYLLRSPDGAETEAVRIPLEKPGAFTVCLSSQVGCAMRCDFCATGRLGLTRNLEAWEIVSAFCTVREEAREAGGRVTGAVFMGQGEPFHNYDAVIQAARVLSHSCGGRIAKRAISISTVGLVPQIRRYTREGHRYRLIVSLTSAISDRRRSLLPVAGRFPLSELAEAIRAHAAQTGTRSTIAWVLMGGVNHDLEEASALERLLGDVPLRINLIDVNDPRPDGYRRATAEERAPFFDELARLGPVVRRYSGGQNEHAACGMLRNSVGRDPGSRPGDGRLHTEGPSG